jgi:hypothetical protein
VFGNDIPDINDGIARWKSTEDEIPFKSLASEGYDDNTGV